MNLPLLTSVLSIATIVGVGRRQWWGQLFGVANCVVFMVIALHGQWGYIPSNLICLGLYLSNARDWKRHGDLGKMVATESAQVRGYDAWQEQHVPDAAQGRLILSEGGLQEPSNGCEVRTPAEGKMGKGVRRLPVLVLQGLAHRGSGKPYVH